MYTLNDLKKEAHNILEYRKKYYEFREKYKGVPGSKPVKKMMRNNLKEMSFHFRTHNNQQGG